MWTYLQATGDLIWNGEVLATGYSGCGSAKNNHQMEGCVNLGPIPLGRYSFSEPFDSQTHGPLCMHLQPLPETDTHGRGGFLIHGDSFQHPGEASHGCIILPRPVRRQMAESLSHLLEVI